MTSTIRNTDRHRYLLLRTSSVEAAVPQQDGRACSSTDTSPTRATLDRRSRFASSPCCRRPPARAEAGTGWLVAGSLPARRLSRRAVTNRTIRVSEQLGTVVKVGTGAQFLAGSRDRTFPAGAHADRRSSVSWPSRRLLGAPVVEVGTFTRYPSTASPRRFHPDGRLRLLQHVQVTRWPVSEEAGSLQVGAHRAGRTTLDQLLSGRGFVRLRVRRRRQGSLRRLLKRNCSHSSAWSRRGRHPVARSCSTRLRGRSAPGIRRPTRSSPATHGRALHRPISRR